MQYIAQNEVHFFLFVNMYFYMSVFYLLVHIYQSLFHTYLCVHGYVGSHINVYI